MVPWGTQREAGSESSMAIVSCGDLQLTEEKQREQRLLHMVGSEEASGWGLALALCLLASCWCVAVCVGLGVVWCEPGASGAGCVPLASLMTAVTYCRSAVR